MDAAFREHPVFSRVHEPLFGSDEAFRAFQNMLLNNPHSGDVIQGTGGVRKVRWSDPGRGKGKTQRHTGHLRVRRRGGIYPAHLCV